VKAEAIRNSDEPTVAVLDVDQAELALNPTRTRVWAPVGAPWEVETPGNNRKQGMFGAVNSRSGQTHFQLSGQQHRTGTDGCEGLAGMRLGQRRHVDGRRTRPIGSDFELLAIDQRLHSR
jgi:hypothetical protein